MKFKFRTVDKRQQRLTVVFYQFPDFTRYVLAVAFILGSAHSALCSAAARVSFP